MTTEAAIDRSRAFDYETVFILRADIDAEASERAISRVVNVVEQNNGTLLKVESWGKRRLAYPIRKQRRGFYVYVRFLGYRGLVAEIERNLRMLDSVLRYMTVQLRRNVDPASVTVDPEEVKVRRIEITEADEEREESIESVLGLVTDEPRSERRDRRDEDLSVDEPVDPTTITPPAAEVAVDTKEGA